MKDYPLPAGVSLHVRAPSDGRLCPARVVLFGKNIPRVVCVAGTVALGVPVYVCWHLRGKPAANRAAAHGLMKWLRTYGYPAQEVELLKLPPRPKGLRPRRPGRRYLSA